MNQSALQAKEAVVKEVVESAKNAKSVLICEYRGLTVAELTELRRLLKKENAKLAVYKNSLVERAAAELGYTSLNPLLEGPNAIIFADDAISGAKVLTKYAKANDKLVVKGGIVEGSLLDGKQLVTLSKLPGRGNLRLQLRPLPMPKTNTIRRKKTWQS